MKDLKPNRKKNPPKKKDVQDHIEKDILELDKMETIKAPNLQDLAKENLENYANDINGQETIIQENLKQDTDYLEEGSEAQHKAFKEAKEFDEDLIVSHDYGSSEWKLITSAINEKLDYRSLTHAMPIGSKGQSGVLIKTMIIMSGSCTVHQIYDPKLRIVKDPEAINLYILK